MMTKQVNINISRCRGMRPKTLAAYVIATAALMAIMSIVTSMSEHTVNAQMMMGAHSGGLGNMTSGLQELQQKAVANGTINLEQTIFNAIHYKVNTLLSHAITPAERSVVK